MAVRRFGSRWSRTETDVRVVLRRLKAVSHSIDQCIVRAWDPESFSKSVKGATISEKHGMKDRKKFAIPKKERNCFTVLGAGHSTTAAILHSVGAHLSPDTLKPRNSTPRQNNSVLDPFTRRSCSRKESKTAVNFNKCSCSIGSSLKVHISKSSQ